MTENKEFYDAELWSKVKLQKENKSLIKRVAHLVRVNKRQRQQIEKLRKELNPDHQYYINVQKGNVKGRRKHRG